MTFDLRWKAACGYGLNQSAYHPTTLKGRRRRALDSTVLDDAVARQDTVTQLIAGIRRLGRIVPGSKELVAAHATGYDYTRPGKPDIAWDDPDAKGALVTALFNDALARAGGRGRGRA